MPRHDRHEYNLHLTPEPELDRVPEPLPPPGYEHWGLTNTTRDWPTPQQERSARAVVILLWWLLVPAMLLAVFFAPELRHLLRH